MRVIAFSLLLTILLALVPSEATEIEVNSVGESVQKDSNPFSEDQYHCNAPYRVPEMKCKLEYLETFQGDSQESGKWVYSYHRQYAGQSWNWGYGYVKPTLDCDKALITELPSAKYGITSFFDSPISNFDKDLVVQYEVRYQKGLECGGAYIKLLRDGTIEAPEDLTDTTPYVLMFGPDFCGETNRIHVIIPHYNPMSDSWEEKKLMGGPQAVIDSLTHLYTLIIRKDGGIEILVDQINKFTGSLFLDFQPPFSTPATIPDPTDKKPADWVDTERIRDPTDIKPADWDESQPRYILDEKAVKPADWLEDEPLQIPDPQAVAPEDWDEELYGPFEAPLVPNPRCQEVSGCGPWEKPMIANPLFKGRYTYRTILNPAYKGPWFPRFVSNPAYYEEKFPQRLPAIKGVAIEIWTMQEGIAFDNILIAHDEDCAQAFADATFRVKRALELKEHPEAGKRQMMSRAEKPSERDDELDGETTDELEEVVWVGKRRAGMSLSAYVAKMVDSMMGLPFKETHVKTAEKTLQVGGILIVLLLGVVYYMNRNLLGNARLI